MSSPAQITLGTLTFRENPQVHRQEQVCMPLAAHSDNEIAQVDSNGTIHRFNGWDRIESGRVNSNSKAYRMDY